MKDKATTAGGFIPGQKPAGLRTKGSRATEVLPSPNHETLDAWMVQRWGVRRMTMAEFIEHLGSGTLRKNDRLGMNTRSHALSERTHYEFGGGFECLPERFVTWGEARSEPDSSPVTEAGWYADRYAHMCLFPGDEMEVKYLIVEAEGQRREGIGIVIRKTSAPWVPAGYMVVAIIAEYDPEKHDFREAVNPC